jgi:hypothetical protein
MIRYIIAGVAAIALTTGAAFAQDSYSTTTTMTRSADVPTLAPEPLAPPIPLVAQPGPAPVGPSYSERSISDDYDWNGMATQRRQQDETRQRTFYDHDGELSAHTTTTHREWRSSTSIAPAPVDTRTTVTREWRSGAAPAPVPVIPSPVPPVSTRTTTTHEWDSSIAAAPISTTPPAGHVIRQGNTRIYVPPGATATTRTYPDGTTSTTVTSPVQYDSY